MKQLKKYALFVSVWLMPYISPAQEKTSGSFSLKEAIDYAMKNSPNFLNANSDIVAAKYKKREIAGLGYPQINASFDLKDFFFIPVSVIPNFVAPAVYQGIVSATTPTGTTPVYDPAKSDPSNYPLIQAQFGTKYQANASASISQIIFSSDYIVALQAAKYLELMSTLSANRTKADVIAAVSKAYYTVLVNNERLGLLNSNINRLKNLLSDTKAYNQQGFVELIDVERLEVTYNNLVSEKEKVERFMNLSDAVLRFQMGYSENQPLTLTEKLPDNTEDQQLEAGKVDPSNRPEYKLAQSSHELNLLNLKRHRLGYMPSLVAYGSLGYSAYRTEFDVFKIGGNWFPSSLIGGTFSLNIFDGLQRHNRIQQARIEIMKSTNTLKFLEQSVDLETRTAIASFNNALSSLKIQSRNKDLATHVQEVAQKKYQGGLGSNIEVVTAETSLKEAQTNYYNALYDMLVAKIDYQKAIGTLVK